MPLFEVAVQIVQCENVTRGCDPFKLAQFRGPLLCISHCFVVVVVLLFFTFFI